MKLNLIFKKAFPFIVEIDDKNFKNRQKYILDKKE